MKSFIDLYKNLDSKLKRTSGLICLTYFFVLFSYPLVRSATSAMFYEVYTSADYSFATFISVVALIIAIGCSNKIQTRIGVHKLFVLTGLVTIVTLFASFLAYKSGIKEAAYVLFATKEAYIVLLIHTTLAFANIIFDIDQFKTFIGPLGAAGSVGGIAGGTLTAYLANGVGTDAVFLSSLVMIFCTLVAFYGTRTYRIKSLETGNSITPLKAIRGIKKYVFLIAAVVGLSQCVIFIADLQFNIVFEQVVTSKNDRTAYLGNFYSYINIFSLFLQFVVLPFALTRIKLRSVFIFIPVLYMVLVFGGLGFGIGSLFVISSIFITMKGIDYSLFNAVKEVMYHPLFSLQKYGAKYIIDMFIYRVAKALIAFGMAQFAITDMKTLSSLQFVFLGAWVIVIILLFKEQKKIKN